MRKLICILTSVLSVSLSSAFAEEPPPPEPIHETEYEEYLFPYLKPEVRLSGGYRYVHLNGSARVDEYGYLHDSLAIGGEVRAFSLYLPPSCTGQFPDLFTTRILSSSKRISNLLSILGSVILNGCHNRIKIVIAQ